VLWPPAVGHAAERWWRRRRAWAQVKEQVAGLTPREGTQESPRISNVSPRSVGSALAAAGAAVRRGGMPTVGARGENSGQAEVVRLPSPRLTSPRELRELAARQGARERVERAERAERERAMERAEVEWQSSGLPPSFQLNSMK